MWWSGTSSGRSGSGAWTTAAQLVSGVGKNRAEWEVLEVGDGKILRSLREMRWVPEKCNEEKPAPTGGPSRAFPTEQQDMEPTEMMSIEESERKSHTNIEQLDTLQRPLILN